MKLINAYEVDDGRYILYNLLSERTPDQSISHKGLPSLYDHCMFFESKPYWHWYLIKEGNGWVGAVYLTHQREVGLFLFKEDQGKGYGKKVIEELVRLHGLPLYANISPNNLESIGFFVGRGFRHIQNTYMLTET